MEVNATLNAAKPKTPIGNVASYSAAQSEENHESEYSGGISDE